MHDLQSLTGTPTALVVDDHPLVADSVAALIRVRHPGAVVEQTRTLRATLALAQRERGFRLIVLDLSLPDSRGADTFFAVRQHWPDAGIVVFTGASNARLETECRQHGAADYVTKADDTTALQRAMAAVLGELAPVAAPTDAGANLTTRQMAIWKDIAAGYSNGEIAERHAIALSTVKSHVSDILERTGARNRTEAARLFFDQRGEHGV